MNHPKIISPKSTGQLGLLQNKHFAREKFILVMLCSLIIFSLISLAGCLEKEAEPARDFIKPEKTCTLPQELKEISGLTDVDGNTVAAVHDESGTIYFYDLENCSIKSQVDFAGTGDFEGLTRVGDNFFALRSDGTLFEITTRKNSDPTVEETKLNVPAGDNEGLAYDQKMNRLLIAPKAKFDDPDFGKKYRAVYAFDLKTGKMQDEPVLQIAIEDAELFLAQQAGVEMPKKKKSGASHFRFDISSIAVHPVNDHYYLLVNSSHLVLIADRTGKLVDAFSLDKKVFPQPEGLTFLENNKLVVSSEGAGKEPAIGVFNR